MSRKLEMSGALDPLANPLEVLGLIPDVMTWKGTWDVNTQYYYGNVVECPTAITSYVCNTLASRGGNPPSSNPNWTELSSAATGVLSLTTGVGLQNTGTATNVNLINTGLTALTVGAGIQNTNTPTAPNLVNTGVLSVGIGAGLQNTGTPTALQLANTGILGLNAGTGLSSTGGQTPTLANSGILTLTAGTGLSSTGGQTPTLSNSGILTLTAGTGLSSTGGQNPTLSVTTVSAPKISMFTTYNLIQPIGPDPTVGGGTFVATFPAVTPATAVVNDLANGNAFPNSIWRFDLTKLNIQLGIAKPVVPTDNCTYIFVDNTTAGGPYVYAPELNSGDIEWVSLPSASLPYQANLGMAIVSVVNFRATGARTIDEIHIFNNTPGQISMVSKGDVYCDFFPNGLE